MINQAIKSISHYHEYMGLEKPKHPLISLIKFEAMKRDTATEWKINFTLPFYSISLKRNFNGKVKYGQQKYDFNEGILTFMAPNQVLSIVVEEGEDINHTGWMLLIHPDYLWNTQLSRSIKQYEYFNYYVNEALHLSEKEETMLTGIMRNIAQEYDSNIDQFSQDVIIAQLELLLTYADRFYHRQFLTRKITHHQILNRLEEILSDYLNSEALSSKGLPTVQYIANALNLSPNYLSGVLKVLTGQSTQQHIHDKLIEKAKEKLSTTTLSVSEVAYALGFEHSQSFSKLFKSKTNQSPLTFRNAFNQ